MVVGTTESLHGRRSLRSVNSTSHLEARVPIRRAISSSNETVRTTIRCEYDAFTFYCFLTLGIAMLWPWNCFVSATRYFLFQLDNSKILQKNFQSSYMFVATLTTGTVTWLLSLKHTRADYPTRIRIGLIIEIIVFSVLALSFSISPGPSLSPAIYFIFVQAVNCLAAGAAGSVQNGIFSFVHYFHNIHYTQAVMIGQAISGVLPYTIQLFSAFFFHSHPKTERLGDDPNNDDSSPPNDKVSASSAVRDFLIAVILFIIALLYSERLVRKSVVMIHEHRYSEDVTPLVAYNEERLGLFFSHRNSNESYDSLPSTDNETEVADVVESSTSALGQAGRHMSVDMMPSLLDKVKPVSLSTVLRQLWMPGFSVFYAFSLCLAFPVFAVKVMSINQSNGWIVTQPDFFVPLAMFMWNLGDCIGRFLPSVPSLMVENGKLMLLYTFLRTGFIGLLMLSNIPGRGPIVHSDLFYLGVQLLFGITNGHICSSCMMSIGNFIADPAERPTAGGVMGLTICWGLVAGSVLSFGYAAMI